MALVLKKLFQGYFWMFDEVADPRASDYFLGGSPFPVIAIVVVWYNFVYYWGPQYMQNRKPYDLKKVLYVYNAIQILVNGYIMIQAFRYLPKLSWTCTEMDYSDNPDSRHVLNCVYIYFLTKILDLFDTVFFVLKKNFHQVSFLHVYHHFGMAMMTWIGFKFVGGGHSIYLGMANSTVHVILYIYYLLSAIEPSYKKVLWLKKLITQVQLAQFVFLIYVYGQLLFQPDCNYPKIVSFFFIPQNFFMIILFSDFYYKAYIKPKRKSNQGVKAESFQ